MERPIELPQAHQGGSLHPLVGRCVRVRNHYECSGLSCASDIFGDGGVPGAPRFLEGMIVEVHPVKFLRPGSGWLRVGYRGSYFPDGWPRYGNVTMRRIKTPNT